MSLQMPEVLALIPARGGSKRIPRKNIHLLAGKPMIAYSIEQALRTPEITRVIVSTDDEEIAAVSREWGADVPFLRPAEFAQDLSSDFEVFNHALVWLAEHENYRPAICAHLRPTHPVRRIEDICGVIQTLRDNPQLHSVRSIALAPETPYKMWFRDDAGRLTPIITTNISEAHSMPRQMLPKVYLQNANIDAIRSEVIVDMHSMTGKNIFGYVMEDSFDIDDLEQLQRAEQFLIQQGGSEA